VTVPLRLVALAATRGTTGDLVGFIKDQTDLDGFTAELFADRVDGALGKRAAAGAGVDQIGRIGKIAIDEVRDGNADLVAFNDDWETDQEAEILFSGQAPTDPRESAIERRLNPGFYTAIMRGKNATLGFGLVEVYLLP